MAYIVIFSAVMIFAIVMVLACVRERKIWNNGICKETGRSWVYFDTDSQGHDGYKSYDKSGKEVQLCWIFPLNSRKRSKHA